MKQHTKRIISHSLIAVHFLVVFLIFEVLWFPRNIHIGQLEWDVYSQTTSAAYIFLMITMSTIYNCYRFGLYRIGDLVFRQIIGNLISTLLTYLLACIMTQSVLRPLVGIAAFALQTCYTGVWFVLCNKIYFMLHRPRRTAVVYKNEQDLKKISEIRFYANKWLIDRIIRCDDCADSLTALHEDNLGLTSEAESRITVSPDINEIIPHLKGYSSVFVSGIDPTLRNEISKFCVSSQKECFFVPHIGDVLISGATHLQSLSVPVMRVRRRVVNPETLFAKRVFDIFASLMAIVILLPLMLIVALAVRIYDHGPALYKQTRLTKDGKEFQIFKFRSMRMDAEGDGVARLSSGENDDRITPVGKVIRATRLDELPQLFNILIGDMSVVGPRPERPEIAEEYEKILPEFRLRLQVKAGLTGYAQIYGKYNTEPADKLKMDLMYINNLGIIEDLRLIFATIRILFDRESTQGIDQGKTTAAG